ncbi:MAG: LemA family protein, partial [Acidobacteriota bacterium]|nr:LemA family protein [Acidobacteriota bacterium]
MNKKLVLLGCGLALAAILVVAVILFFYVSSAYNGLVSLDEVVAAGWSQVENVYQRRADLVPNL